jgi:hypothetical protein
MRERWAEKDLQKLSDQINEELEIDDDTLFDQSLACSNPDVDSDSETVKKECSSSKALKKYWWVDEFMDYVNKTGDPDKCRVKPDEVRNTLCLYMKKKISFQTCFETEIWFVGVFWYFESVRIFMI